MRRVDAQDAREPRQRTGQVQLVTGPGNMAVAEVLQIVVDARGHGHPAAACGHHLLVLGVPELTQVQAVVGEALVDRHDELRGSVPDQSLEQPNHGSPLSLVAGFRFEVVQSCKLTAGTYKKTKHDDQNQAAAVSGWHFDAQSVVGRFPTGAQV